MAPEVMLFVWGSGVVPISVKKALLGLIPTRRRTQGSSPQPRPGQPPPPGRNTFILCLKGPPEGKAPERQGSEHPHGGVAAHNQKAQHKATHTHTSSSAPSPSCARLPPCPTRPQDPLDAIQRHIKFIPPHAASQQALDSDWRVPEAKGGVCAENPPRMSLALLAASALLSMTETGEVKPDRNLGLANKDRVGELGDGKDETRRGETGHYRSGGHPHTILSIGKHWPIQPVAFSPLSSVG
ncbi:hypothetical protein Q5P01_004895 [Channa striata]|uniref:Uncharacterized protein n=1 Tax=Channa striata TaxID=64152 RepID=A0AA88NHG2_CHASR|nr:hypothetical protein Q5P01_004895 [Channa striata]